MTKKEILKILESKNAQSLKHRALNGDKKMLIEKINDYYIVTIIK